MSAPVIPADLRLLVLAAGPHVAFDGWSPTAFEAARQEIGMDPDRARALAPRGALDLAVASHRMGDAEMARLIAAADMTGLRYRDRVALALRLRLQAIPDREAVRRASAMFALPHLAPQGAALIWGTADAIWRALGDTATDGNWYTKRATLSAVWAAVVVFWLGDDSAGADDTAAFIDRRIDNVMSFEKAKAWAADAPVLGLVAGPIARFVQGLSAPGVAARDDLPGHLKGANDA